MDSYGYEKNMARSYAGSMRESISEFRHPSSSRQPAGEGSTTFVETSDGWLFRPPENGHVVTRGEMVARMIPYYEMFLTNVFLLGYNVLRDAAASVKSDFKTVLFDACTDRWVIKQFDFCAASRLVWGLIGGALVYFVVTTIVALFLAIELRRKGYHASFTAMWHSPLFVLCLLYPAHRRVDVLTIPNKFVGLSIWTRAHIHKVAFALYSGICTALIIVSLSRGTAEEFRILSDKSINRNGLGRYYNPYLAPYYIALYIFGRVFVTTILEIFQSKNLRNRPERVGRLYTAIKDD